MVEGYSPQYTGDKWQNLTATRKCGILTSRVNEDKTPYGWYDPVSSSEILIENLATSFDAKSDDMPSQGLLSEERKKLIHSVGAVANCKFIPILRSNFTGIFRGSQECVVRFSLAREASTDPPSITPGISVKFLRTGRPSGNLFAMYSLLGQPSFNFFEHDLTNQPPDFNPDTAPLPIKLLRQAFLRASPMPTLLGLSDLAQYDENGVESTAPVFPFRIIFHPTKAVHDMFPSDPQPGDYYLAQMATLPLGTVYNVYTMAAPGSPATFFGMLNITSQPSSSKFGDKDMFFQHTHIEADLAFRPEWTDAVNAMLEQQRSGPVAPYPDLPWV